MSLEHEKWIGIVLHERFDEEGKGFVEMWVNGEQVTSFKPGTYNPGGHAETTRLTMSTLDSSNDGEPNNVRIEQYREKGQFEVGTVYFGPLRVGPTREDVDSGRRASRSARVDDAAIAEVDRGGYRAARATRHGHRRRDP